MRKKFDKKVLQKLVQEALPGRLKIQPASGGISTNVYRVENSNDVYYLRITGYEGQSFQAEFIAHQKISAVRSKIPKIIYHRNFCREIDNHSFMITEGIKGKPVSSYEDWHKLKQVFINAGQDLAKINSISVNGFGWIERKAKNIEKLYAHRDTYQDYMLRDFQEKLTILVKFAVLTKTEADQLQSIKNKFQEFLGYDQACLTHGDFDVTHIYCQGDRYTGIIDFGDIMGTSPFADLAHFKAFCHPTEEIFPWLLEGYGQIHPLPEDINVRLTVEGVLIAVKKLSYIAQTMPERISNHRAIPKLKQNISDLNSKL